MHAAVGAGVLTVVRQRPGQQPYTGVVQIVHGTIAQDLTRYLAESEQSNTALALGVQHDERGGVRAAAGFLVEALPGASPEEIDRVEENVRATEAPSELALCGVDAHGLAVRLLDGLGIRETHEMQVGFHCGCDEERVATAARLLGREELERSAREDDPLEIRCRFCGNAYRLGPEELASLLEES